jgi:prevent-host-death family protein
MKTVTIHEAKTHLSRLIREAVAGEEIVIARGREPLVRLVVLDSARTDRRLGTARGLFEIGPDFDEPLADFEDYR